MTDGPALKPLLIVSLIAQMFAYNPLPPVREVGVEKKDYHIEFAAVAYAEPLQATHKPMPVLRPSPNSNVSQSLADWLLRLRMCESGGRYDLNVGKYDGAYQFLDSTWDKWDTGYASADVAPPAVQDATVIKNTNASKGGLASQHPGCFKEGGLSQFPPN